MVHVLQTVIKGRMNEKNMNLNCWNKKNASTHIFDPEQSITFTIIRKKNYAPQNGNFKRYKSNQVHAVVRAKLQCIQILSSHM